MTETEIVRALMRLPPEGGPRTAACPGEDGLAAYVDCRLGARSRERLERHLADCSACLGQVAFLVHTRESADTVATPTRWLTEASRPRGPRWQLLPTTVGALGWALAGAFLLLLVEPGGRSGRLDRGTGASRTAVRAVEATGRSFAPRLVEPQEGEVVGRKHLNLRWAAVPGALDYTVQVMNAAGDLVWEARVASVAVPFPGSLELEPGSEYFVWVDAHLPGGADARSPATLFRVQGR